MSRTQLAIVLTAVTGAVAAPAFATSPLAETSATKARLQVRTGAIGTYLVDASGRSLYLFTKDTARKSACTGTCSRTWPPYLTSGKPRAGTGVSSSKLGTLRRGNGSTQVTYNGHPLYRYAADTAKGQTRGHGSGSAWYLVTPAGKRLAKAAPPTATAPTPTPGGYGY